MFNSCPEAVQGEETSSAEQALKRLAAMRMRSTALSEKERCCPPEGVGQSCLGFRPSLLESPLNNEKQFNILSPVLRDPVNHAALLSQDATHFAYLGSSSQTAPKCVVHE